MEIKLPSDKIVKIPKILYQLYDNAKAIKRILTNTDRDELANAWGVKLKKSDDAEVMWLNLVNKCGELKKGEAALIYKAGLRAL